MMRSLLTILFTVAVLVAHAQFPLYCVYFYKGDVRVQGSKGKKEKVAPRQLLMAGDILWLNNQAQVTLVNPQGVFLTLQGRKKVEVRQLKPAAVSPETITAKYFHLLWEELLDPTRKPHAQVVAASWGGGIRGACDLTVYPKNGYKYSGDSLRFYWHDQHDPQGYAFTIWTREGEERLKMIVQDTQLVVPTAVIGSASILWSVQARSQPCEPAPRYKIELLSPGQEQELVGQLLQAVPREENDVLYYLSVADMLGQHGLVEQALLYINKSRETFMRNRQSNR